MAKVFNNPTFIPKVLDNTVINSGVDFKAVLVDAHFCFYREEVLNESKKRYEQLLIDPVTYFLQFPAWYEKANFKKLPYSDVTNIQQILSDPTFRLNSLVVPALDFQINNGATFIISPYLCGDDINSALFMNNLTILGESLYILKGKENHPKVLASICICSNQLRDRKLTNYIVDLYKDKSFYEDIDGYFITIPDFDDRQADEDQLLGLADIVYQLSQDKDVIINHIGGFGDVLGTIGLSGFVSSPGGGETFSLKLMQQGKTDARSRKHDQWRYIPELFDYVNETELVPEKINYQCDCFGCIHSSEFPSVYAARKTHFLIKKAELTAELNGKTQEERINLMIAKLTNAITAAQTYKNTFGSDIKINHLIKWKKVLEAASNWSYHQNDDELDKILEGLD